MDFNGKLSKYFFSNEITYFFLVVLIEIFILKTTMYHKYTLKYQKFTKKNVKKTLHVYVPFCAKHWRHICAIPDVIICHLFFQLLTSIWLLHCNAMHFDSFSLGARHLFQKLLLFFYVKLYL
jgi:GT2 family glycosyltransferase